MNEREQAQWLVDNMFAITNDLEMAKLAARFVAEEAIQEIVDHGGNAERAQLWMHVQQMITNNEITNTDE